MVKLELYIQNYKRNIDKMNKIQKDLIIENNNYVRNKDNRMRD